MSASVGSQSVSRIAMTGTFMRWASFIALSSRRGSITIIADGMP
jgi:hypothetical protein